MSFYFDFDHNYLLHAETIDDAKEKLNRLAEDLFNVSTNRRFKASLRLKNGLRLFCETTEDVIKATAVFEDQISEFIEPNPNQRKKKKSYSNDPRGAGTQRRWAMAQWYATKKGGSVNDWRSKMTNMQPARKERIKKGFTSFVSWYSRRIKATNQNDAINSLLGLYKSNPENYKELLNEHTKATSKASSRR